MDLYHPNPTTLGRLLTKRQNPCTQIFKAQPSNPNNVPMSTINLARNDISASHDEKSAHFSGQNSTPDFFAPNSNFQSPIQTSPEIPSTQAQPTETGTVVDEDDDDAAPDHYDRVQKKLKTATFVTTELRSRRNSSFEEEKEESDHSTSCETRSDFNNACETGDTTPFSPPMTHQPVREPSDLRLDGSEGNLRSCGLNLNFSHKGQETAQTIGENLCNLLAGGSKKPRCKLNHQWEMDLNSISKKGCSRCSDLLEECREFARKNQGSCLNEEYDETIRYRCIKGHIWSLNYKNARRRWCAQCAKEQRAYLKKKCEEEKLEREKQDEAYQKKLFEEAKKKAIQDNPPKQPFNNTSGQNAGTGNPRMSLLEYFQRIDYEIESLAKKYTLEFMSRKEFGGDMTFQQILQVYKISIMPEEVLQTYMFNLNIETLKAEFRRMAKAIHPDKNKHPQAGNAFQKIYKVYEVALSRLEGAQQKI
jgi:hypothetical protein